LEDCELMLRGSWVEDTSQGVLGCVVCEVRICYGVGTCPESARTAVEGWSGGGAGPLYENAQAIGTGQRGSHGDVLYVLVRVADVV
jgi:hypothetical protein